MSIRLGTRWAGVPAARAVMLLALAAFLVALAMLAHRLPAAAPFALAVSPAILLCLFAGGVALVGRRGSPALFKAAMVCAMLALVAARR